MTMLPRLFHGGIPGLKPGDLIVPSPYHVVDGCPICAAKAAGQQPVVGGINLDPLTERTDRVYLTSDREYARWYASKYPRGDLYVVEPIGEVEPSTEDPFDSWCAESARITGVYDRYVQLTWPQRRRLLARWKVVDEMRDRPELGRSGDHHVE